jgi:hypothetical protein
MAPFESYLDPGPSKLFQVQRKRRLLLFLCASATFVLVLVLNTRSSRFLSSYSSSSYSSTQAQCDLEDDFRWRGRIPPGHRPSIPFLLNRFGYPTPEAPDDPLPAPPPRFGIQTFRHPSAIPSIVHFVPPGGDRFGFIQWLAVSSASHVLRPTQIFLHTMKGTEPEPGSNFWWEKAKEIDAVKVRPVDEPDEVMGRRIVDRSHKADVLRIEALLEWGGIYLDSDVVVTR